MRWLRTPLMLAVHVYVKGNGMNQLKPGVCGLVQTKRAIEYTIKYSTDTVGVFARFNASV